MIRLYIPQYTLFPHFSFEATAEQNHYLLHVMRLKPNDPILLFNEKSGEFLASAQIKKKSITFTVEQRMRSFIAPPPLWLAFCLIKPHLMHLILEKATELGVTHIQPLISEYSQIRSIHIEKFQKIVIEASEQSERLDIPTIRPVISLSDFCDNLPAIQWLACLERTQAQPILSALHAHPASGVIVGPEGGFSQAEKTRLQAQNIIPISLGNTILRAETAVIYGLSCLNAFYHSKQHDHDASKQS